MSRTCPACGAIPDKDDDRFCNNCGRELPPAPEPPPGFEIVVEVEMGRRYLLNYASQFRFRVTNNLDSPAAVTLLMTLHGQGRDVEQDEDERQGRCTFEKRGDQSIFIFPFRALRPGEISVRQLRAVLTAPDAPGQARVYDLPDRSLFLNVSEADVAAAPSISISGGINLDFSQMKEMWASDIKNLLTLNAPSEQAPGEAELTWQALRLRPATRADAGRGAFCAFPACGRHLFQNEGFRCESCTAFLCRSHQDREHPALCKPCADKLRAVKPSRPPGDDPRQKAAQLAVDARADLDKDSFHDARRRAAELVTLGPHGAPAGREILSALAHRAEDCCDQARAHLHKADLARAEALLHNARTIDPACPKLTPLAREIEQLKHVRRADELSKRIEAAIAGRSFANVYRDLQRLAEQGELGASKAQALRPRLDAARNELIAQARAALKSHRSADATDAIRTAQTLAPRDPALPALKKQAVTLAQAVDLRDRLADVVEKQQYAEAGKILSELDKWPPFGPELAKPFRGRLIKACNDAAKNAQKLVRANRWKDARAALEAALSIRPDDENLRHFMQRVEAEVRVRQKARTVAVLVVVILLVGAALAFILFAVPRFGG